MSTLSNNFDYQSITESKKLTKYKSKHTESKRIADLFTVLGYKENLKQSERTRFLQKANFIRSCNTIVYHFRNIETQESIIASNFCQQRFCPICAYNEELKHFKIFAEIVNSEKLKNCNWVFITLTVKNPNTEQLGTSIDLILNGFRKLNSNKQSFLNKHCLGMFRTLEITKNKKDGTFHPHLHILYCVDSSYSPNSKNWITHKEIQSHWKNICKLDYEPIVDIRYVDTTEKNNAVAEVSKYQVKSTDINNADTLYILDKVSHYRKFKTYTGVIKELKKEIEERLESEKIDLKSIILDERFVKELFKWNSFKNCFRYDRIGSERLNNSLKHKKEQEQYIQSLVDSLIPIE